MRKTSFLIVSAITVLAATALVAENAVLLEGFEQNMDTISILGSRSTASLYTKTSPEDGYVTQGTNSLQVELAATEYYGQDLSITFSDADSAKIREAALSPDMARYVLRWDVVFPGSEIISWMNVQAFISGVSWFDDQLDSNNTNNTMSISLDLISTNLSPDQPITITLADNFDAKEDPFSSLKLYFDNFRLVDTYAPGAKAVVYTLQSFEDTNNPTGGAENFTGWGGGTRTTYSQYTSQAPDDVRVSDGTHSLQVDYAGAGTWGSDFTIPFNDTKLAEVLKLDLPAEERPTPAELARYTFRFEVTYPAQTGTQGSWENTSYNTQAAGFPWSQGGTFGQSDTLGFTKTYSVTLDQTRWADWTDPKPSLMFIHNGDWADTGTTLYYDNFRLIDTGAIPSPTNPHINSINVNAQGKVVITWTGSGSLQSSPSIGAPQWTTITGATSGSPIDPPASGVAFYRVQAP